MDFRDLVVVVLAGKDRDSRILGGEADGPSKFFMDFGEELAGHRIIRAVDSLLNCRSIYVVGPQPYISDYAFEAEHPLCFLEQCGTRTENLERALEEAKDRGGYTPGEHILLVMGDLPLLEARAIREYVLACERAEEADLYVGLIPARFVDPSLREIYRDDAVPYSGEACLLANVYLLRWDSVTEEGKTRYECIMAIRRVNRGNLSDLLKSAIEILRIAGLRGVVAFARVIAGMHLHKISFQGRTEWVSNGVEGEVIRIVRNAFGPSMGFVEVNEPCLGYEFDYGWQLDALREYDAQRNWRAGTISPSTARG